MTKSRSEIGEEMKWDLTQLFESDEAWEKSFEKPLQPLTSRPLDQIDLVLDHYFETHRALHNLYTYAHLKHDEDVADEKYKSMHDRAMARLIAFGEETSWLIPAIVALDEVTSDKYAFYLEKVRALKPHTLSDKEERIMALAGQLEEAPHKTFGVMHNADMKFDDVDGEPLTHGSYGLFMQNPDRSKREKAFHNLHRPHIAFENTYTELLSSVVQKHLFNRNARGYKTSLEAALKPHQIPVEVYHSLLEAVDHHLGSLHDYVALRKKILGVDELQPYDLYVPLEGEIEKRFTIDEAKELVLEAVRPLGAAYRDTLAKGFAEERWVDWLENERKRSGAYSSGCFDSPPYILMNFHGTIRDVFTLAHEAGHSMHSHLSHTHQPYHSARYPIFLAEVASTYNEELLFELMMKEASSDLERRFLLNHKLDDIRSTLHRQTQFAEFELKIHEMAEQGVPFAAANLRGIYLELYKKYYGPALSLGDEISVEFLRVPHFYYNFYVYQYATGISSAYALYQQGDVERYLKFLSSGGSAYPVDTLRTAGVDLTTPKPIEALLEQFKTYLGEYECLRKKAE